MAQYIVAREGVTPVAGDVLLALTTGADELSLITEVAITGEATSSTVNRMAIRRSSTNGTTPTAQTPAKASPTSPAAYTSAATTFSAQPTTAAAPAVWTYALNVFGGIARWVAAPRQEIVIEGATAGSSEVSLESSNGTGQLSAQIMFEEV
jgi:hypothetical protein